MMTIRGIASPIDPRTYTPPTPAATFNHHAEETPSNTLNTAHVIVDNLRDYGNSNTRWGIDDLKLVAEGKVPPSADPGAPPPNQEFRDAAQYLLDHPNALATITNAGPGGGPGGDGKFGYAELQNYIVSQGGHV